MPHTPSHRASWLASIGLALLLAPGASLAQSPSCPALFKSKAYLKAAACFNAKATAMGKTSRLSKIQRYLKGQALRNAALSYKNSAKGIKNIEVAAYRRSLALGILRRYLADNLCQRAYLCKLAKGETLELINLINYTQLSIVTSPGKRAFVKITGYKYSAEHYSPPQWNKRVRPGKYKIIVRYEGGKEIPKEVLAPPGQSITVTVLLPAKAPPVRRDPITTPKPKPKEGPGALPWVIAGVGLAAALGGGTMLVIGQMQVGQRDDLAKALRDRFASSTPAARVDFAGQNQYNTEKKKIDDAHNTASALILPGWIVLGAGVAVMATGIVLFFALKPKPKPPVDDNPKNALAPRATPHTDHAHTLLTTF